MLDVSLTEINDRTVESAEQDQTARMCRLILLYTLRKYKSMVRSLKQFQDVNE